MGYHGVLHTAFRRLQATSCLLALRGAEQFAARTAAAATVHAHVRLCHAAVVAIFTPTTLRKNLNYLV